MKKNLSFYISASIFFSTTASVIAAPADVSFELVDGLTACTAKLEAASVAGQTADGFESARVSSKGALSYLFEGKGINTERRMIIDEMRQSFTIELQRNPMDARLKVQALTNQCRELVYQADDFRVAEVARLKEDASRKAREEVELRLKEAQAVQQAALAAEKQHALEVAKINAETERLKITTGTQLEHEKLKVGLEETKIGAASSLDLSKIQSDTDRLRIQKNAEVAVEVAKVNSTTAKAEAVANVQIAGKLADIVSVQENASIEREKVAATAQTEIARTNAAAAVTIVGEVAKAQTETARVAANAPNIPNSGHSVAEMLPQPGSSDLSDNEELVMQNALECGGFYKIMLDNAPRDQQQGIGRVMKDMFRTAQNAGASDDMIEKAPTAVHTKIKATATKGKAFLQRELISMKEKCATLQELAKL
ncbi:hypothetical protein ASF70_12780 [Rhizobium sp. Leaf321]|uniref:hypothetical protein n=1 Tax=Rhizobium sp. Leaf321 TaxID=1736335 RepID=UPI0007160D57|nr:hypothetical protein [Rhizobium sp. Leaf321]KQQ72403.1 hypothetical protein ASF70_12780 [Rhizobium sp. Leaf321]